MIDIYGKDLLEHSDVVNELLARYGVKFGIYKNNTFKEQLFPFDPIPRIIEKNVSGQQITQILTGCFPDMTWERQHSAFLQEYLR